MGALAVSGSRRKVAVGDVESFLRGVFIRGDCGRIEIRHRTANGSTRVRDWVIRDLDISERTPDWLALQVIETATNEAASLTGLVQYWLLAFRADDSEPCARIPMPMQGRAVDEGTDLLGDSENGATTTGQMAQAHRHVEAMMRLTIGGMSQAMQYQQSTIRALSDSNDKMAEREERVMAMREELESAQQERKLELIRAEHGENRKNRLLDKAELFLPSIVGKLAPKGDTQLKLAAAVDGVRQTFKSLRPEQLDGLMKLLDPEQAVAIGDAYQAFLAEEVEKEEAEKKRKAAEKEDEAAQ